MQFEQEQAEVAEKSQSVFAILWSTLVPQLPPVKNTNAIIEENKLNRR